MIGQPLEASRAAKHMLEQEGFRHQGYVDVFDAGPTMQAERETIRTVRKSRMVNVLDIREVATKFKHMISNRSLKDFRIVLAGVEESEEGVVITAETARILGVKKDDPVRLIEA